MKKKMLMRLATLCLCAGLVGGSALAAGKIYKNITVQYDNIKLVIDGATITPKDANGSTVEPFIYNGTTYLPVRAVGNAIGKQVTWDGNSKTVYLGEAPGQTNYLVDVCPPYSTTSGVTTYRSADGKSFSMAGQKYSNGFTMRDFMSDPYILCNLNGKYDSMTLTVGHKDGSRDDADGNQLTFVVDGKAVKEITINGTDMPQEITVPLNYGLQLKILYNGAWAMTGTSYDVGLANIVLSE